MKKYKLEDLVSNGSRARREIQSDLLVGDASNGYGTGDILDANATNQLIKDSISDMTGGIIQSEIEDDLLALREQNEQCIQIINELRAELDGKVDATVNGDELIFG